MKRVITSYKNIIAQNKRVIKGTASIVKDGKVVSPIQNRDINYLRYKNPSRDISQRGNGITVAERTAKYVAANPIISYGEVSREWSKDIRVTLCSLMADNGGGLITPRELTYLVTEGKLMKHVPKGYAAIKDLEKMKEEEVIKEYSNYSKDYGVARESKIKNKLKGLSLQVEKFVDYIVTHDYIDLCIEAEESFIINTNPNRKIIYDPLLTERQNDIAQFTMDLMDTKQFHKDQLIQYSRACRFYKQQERDRGLTVNLLFTIINETLPGEQPQRKNRILSRLIKKYKLIPSVDKDREPKNLREPRANFGLDMMSLLFDPKKEEENEELKELNNKTEKYIAANALVRQLKPYLHKLTKKIKNNLKSYEDKDDIDTRQRAKMFNDISPLPLSYVDKGSNSPRLYSEEADNLFACRKGMRIQGLKGLGAYDVDLKSCHTYILLSKWGEHLPLLKEAMKTNTLWEVYKKHYESHKYPFHKKIVKALHYASVLGGGRNAFEQAIHRYNLDNPNEGIKDKEELIKVHKKSPIYKELRKLLKHIEKEWAGKTLRLKTGEVFNIVPSKRYKDRIRGEWVWTKGNLLTALSAYLQSKEIQIMSELILRTQKLYIPLLWQHDGITIIPLKKNWVEEIEKEMSSISQKILGNKDLILDIQKI